MAYIRIGEDESTLGSFGCGPGCSCAGCRQTAGSVRGLGERYVREEEEETTPPPAPTPPTAPAASPRSNLSGWGRFGEPLPQRRLSPTGGLQLRMPAFATLTGFARGGTGLNTAQLERVKRVAELSPKVGAALHRSRRPVSLATLMPTSRSLTSASDAPQRCATHCFARSVPRGLDWRHGFDGS